MASKNDLRALRDGRLVVGRSLPCSMLQHSMLRQTLSAVIANRMSIGVRRYSMLKFAHRTKYLRRVDFFCLRNGYGRRK
ncbi:MAG: hypothetical protein DMF61_26145 [Blastocatellia bacterium AA13]|nr:MAG: hypothetical protein DMF61_26145 [Blastocatellia bacterium AA13]